MKKFDDYLKTFGYKLHNNKTIWFEILIMWFPGLWKIVFMWFWRKNIALLIANMIL